MGEQLYPLTYDIRQEDPPLPRSKVEELKRCACDAIVLLSMLNPPDGSFSLLTESLDGHTGERVTPDVLWKCWVLLASQLGETEGLSPNKRELAQEVFAIVSRAVRGDR